MFAGRMIVVNQDGKYISQALSNDLLLMTAEHDQRIVMALGSNDDPLVIVDSNALTCRQVVHSNIEVSRDVHLAASDEAWRTDLDKGIYMRYNTSAGDDTAFIMSKDLINNVYHDLKIEGSNIQLGPNSNHVYIRYDGHVGIDTNNPTSVLTVNGDAEIPTIRTTDIFSRSNGVLNFGCESNTSSINIGTDLSGAPNTTLTISSHSNHTYVDGPVDLSGIQRFTVAKSNHLLIENNGSAYQSAVVWRNQENPIDTVIAKIVMDGETGAANDGTIKFFTASNATLCNSVTIDKSGFMGIMTTTPTAELQVVGKAITDVLQTTDIICQSNTLNLGCDTDTNTINIGINGSTVTNINIGSEQDVVNIAGTLSYIQTTDLWVDDKYISLNVGGPAGTAGDAGIVFMEGGSNAAYIKTSTDRQSYLLKTPAGTPAKINLASNAIVFNDFLYLDSNSNVGIGIESGIDARLSIQSPSQTSMTLGNNNDEYLRITKMAWDTVFWNGPTNSVNPSGATGAYVFSFPTDNSFAYQTGSNWMHQDGVVSISRIRYPFNNTDTQTAQGASLWINKPYFSPDNKRFNPLRLGKSLDPANYETCVIEGSVLIDSTESSGKPLFKIVQKGTDDILQVLDGSNPVMYIKDGGNIGIGTSTPAVCLEIRKSDGILLPRGITSERPSIPVQGHVRYNTQTSQFEGFGAGDAWGSLGGVIDVNQDTLISAERWPGSNDDNLRFFNNGVETMRITNDGKLGFGTSNPVFNVEFKKTDAMLIPKGTTVERPSAPIQGIIRYNTTTTQFEGFGAGDAWGSLGGVIDVNQDTLISAEKWPGSNDDNLRFFNNGVETMRITNDGKLGFGTSNPVFNIEFNKTDAMLIPKGTTVQRPNAPIQGIIRYNTTTSQFEGFGAGDAWGSLGGVIDVNQDTYISAEKWPGGNDDNLRFFNNAVETMRMTNAGLLGIGNSNPWQRLHVEGPIFGTSNIIGKLGYSNAPTYTFSNDLDTGIWSPTADTVALSTGGIERARISSTGNVGIGTTSPSYLLDLVKSNTADATLRLVNSNNATTAFVQQLFQTDSGNVGVIFKNSTTRTLDGGVNTMTIRNDGGDMRLQAMGGSSAEHLRVQATSGNIAIGTSSPWQKLHVEGSIFGTSNIIGKLGYSNAPTYTFSNDLDTGMWSPVSDTIAFSTNANERIRINSTGNVGIGLTTPICKLQVNGTTKVKNLIATNQKAPTSIAIDAVSSWTTRTSPVDNFWNAICWSPELSLFVAVGSIGTGNRVMTSSDGINWAIRTSAADNNWYGVCWSPELSLFVAVSASGTGNRVMTSQDGINWTSRTSAADSNWYGVCWSSELSLFVAVGFVGSVMTSSDGIIWTSRTTPSTNSFDSVCWSAELFMFVAVAQSGTGNRVMTSTDGINWTSRTSGADNNWQSVCWSAELSLFVAVGSTGTGNRVMTSPDGITWTARTSAADNSWYSVCWSPELSWFVAVSIDGTGNRVMTSPDGINWTLRTSATNNNWRGLCWSPELSVFAAVAQSGTGNRVMTSKPVLPSSKSSLIVNPSHMIADFSTGNVGIGTSAPVYKLHTVGDTFTSGVFTANLGAAATPTYTFSNDLNTGMWSPAADTIAWSTTGSERVRIDSAGFVGIGTSTPAYRLDVGGAAQIGNYLINGNQITSRSNITLSYGSNNAFYLRSYTSNDYNMATYTEVLYANYTGSVGVGNTAPSYKLDVTGDISCSVATFGRALHVKSLSTAATYGTYIDVSASNNTSRCLLGIDGTGFANISAGATLLAAWTNHPMILATNALERVRIDTSGNVGIGTTSITKGKLEVAGVISTTKVGEARYHIYNGGGQAEWKIGQKDNATHNLGFAKSTNGWTSETEYMTLTTAGALGIGTTAPYGRLHLLNPTYPLSNNIVIEAGSTHDGGVAYAGWSAINFNGYYNNAETRINTGKNRWRLYAEQYGTSDIFGIDTYNGTTNSYVISCTTAGNVSIGTSRTPAYLLDIVKASSTETTLRLANTSNASTAFVQQLFQTDSANVGVIYKNSTTRTADGGVNTMTIRNDGGDIRLQATGGNNAEHLRVQATTGYVGIGTSTPFKALHTVGDTFTTGVYIANIGAVGTPTYTFSNDTNTGMWSPAAETIAWSTTGAERMRIDSLGNVGIGVTPSYTLDVNGIGKINNVMLSNNASSAMYVGNSAISLNTGFALYQGVSGDTVLNSASGQPLEFKIGNTEYARIISTGNFGIGTTSPAYKLDVNGTCRTGNTIFASFNRSLSTTTNAWTNICKLNALNGSCVVRLAVAHSESTDAIAKTYDFTVAWTEAGTGATYYELLPITSTGVYNTNDFTVDIATDDVLTSDQCILRLRRVAGTTTTLNYTCSLMINESSANVVTVTDDSTTGTGGTVTAFYNGTQITQVDGKVGIGTSAPGQKLEVNGGYILSKKTGSGSDPAGVLVQKGAEQAAFQVWDYGNNTQHCVIGANCYWNSTGNMVLYNTAQAKGWSFSFGNATDAFAISRVTATDTETKLFYINNAGNTGIGTTAPTYKLHVVGDVFATSTHLANLGSVSAPTYTFSNDTNTGIWSPGADTVAVSTGGAERMRIDSSGNVSFSDQYGQNTTSGLTLVTLTSAGNYVAYANTAAGATNYGKKFVIKSGDTTGNYWGGSPYIYGADTEIRAGSVNLSGNNGTAQVYGYGGNINFYPGYAYVSSSASGNSRYVESGKTNFYYANTNGTSIDTGYTLAMTIDNQGKLGIGTSAPSYKLHVVGDTFTTGVFTANLGSASAPTYTFSNDTNCGMFSPTADTVAFSTSATERVRLDSSGNFGIGVTPAYKLDVSGEVVSRSANGNSFRLRQANYSLILRNDNSDSWFMTTAAADPDGAYNAFRPIRINHAAGFVEIGNASLRVNDSGNVGVGTAAPSQKLHVAGSIQIDDSIVLTKGFSMIYAQGLNIKKTSANANTIVTSGYSYNNNVTIMPASGYHTYLNNGVLTFANNTVFAAPATGTNGSTGDRIILYAGGSGVYPYSIGVSSGNMWCSVPSAGYLWYSAGTSTMSLSSAGALVTKDDITAFGSVSDQKFKENIKDLGSTLDKVCQLRPVEYTWNDTLFNENYIGQRDIGFIAQEVEKVVPEATKDVTFNEDTFKTIKYERIVPLLVGSIKELTEQNKKQQEQIVDLQCRMAKLEEIIMNLAK